MKPADHEWLEILERVHAGDRLAFLELSRLITYLLAGMRAYDFRAEWDDVVQDVTMATTRAMAAGRIRDSAKALAYIRAATRNRLTDALRRGQRARGREVEFDESTVDGGPSADEGIREDQISLRDALADLPDRERDAVTAVYVEGQTYEDAASVLKVPLGSLKRFLKQGLATLRRRLLVPEEQKR